MRDFLKDLATRGGEALMRHYGAVAPEDIELKGPRDLVSYVDRTTEELLVDAILAEYPEDGILGEESSAREGTSGQRWIIDPLDGTTNYLHEIPFFAVSIGVERDGEIIAGAVHAPALGELYLATAGGGATLNGEPIRVSDCAVLGDSLMGTGFADNRQSEAYRTTRFEAMLNRVGGVRRVGAASMDLCMVARGVLDGFWEWNLSAWDVAAGALLVREAGGVVSDGEGGENWLTGRSILATNANLHAPMVEAVNAVEEDPRVSALQSKMRAFVAARGWQDWHEPKNLALSVGIEAAELQEIFQWLTPAEAARDALGEERIQAASDEMADVLAYLLSMADALGVDLARAYTRKMARNAERYPVGGRTPDRWGAGKKEEDA